VLNERILTKQFVVTKLRSVSCILLQEPHYRRENHAMPL